MTILFLALMIVIFSAYQTGTASATTPGSNNLFDMQLFDKERNINKSGNIYYTLTDSRGLIFKFRYNEDEEHTLYYSEYFYLRSGTYTLSFFVEGIDFENFDYEFRVYTAEGDDYIEGVTVSDNELKSFTFVVDNSINYKLCIRINNIVTPHDNIIVSVNDIMLNEGAEALPFEPYIETNDEIDAINNQTNTIIAWLEGAFKTESGIIAGASVGTFLLLAFAILFVFKRR